MKIIRYSNLGFDKFKQTHIDENIVGCFCFCEFVDKYLLSGTNRINEAVNIADVHEDTIVYARNVVYSFGVNQFGYKVVFSNKFDETKESFLTWILVPLWFVYENAKFLNNNNITGEFGTEFILI